MMTRSLLFSIIRATGTVLAVALLARLALFQVFSIPSQSMSPALETGDQIVVTPYRGLVGSSDPKPGDVIVFARPGTGEYFVKRVIAAPGDHVEIRGGAVLLNGHAFTEAYAAQSDPDEIRKPEIIPANRYFVLGDNRPVSIDSRAWGLVDRDQIVGRARFIYWSSATAEAPPAVASTALAPKRPRAARWDRIFKRVR